MKAQLRTDLGEAVIVTELENKWITEDRDALPHIIEKAQRDAARYGRDCHVWMIRSETFKERVAVVLPSGHVIAEVTI